MTIYVIRGTSPSMILALANTLPVGATVLLRGLPESTGTMSSGLAGRNAAVLSIVDELVDASCPAWPELLVAPRRPPPDPGFPPVRPFATRRPAAAPEFVPPAPRRTPGHSFKRTRATHALHARRPAA